MLEKLTNAFTDVFRTISGKSSITEKNRCCEIYLMSFWQFNPEDVTDVIKNIWQLQILTADFF